MSSQADLLDRLRHHRDRIADLTGHLLERPGTVTMQRAQAELRRVEREGGASLHFAPTYALIEQAGWELAGCEYVRPRGRRGRHFAARHPRRRQGWRRTPRRRR